MTGFQQREFDEILSLDEATDRRRRRNHQQGVAGIWIEQLVQLTGIGQRHGHVGERGIGDVAQHHQRQRRRLHTVGKGQRPIDAAAARVAFQGRHLRPVQANTDGEALVQRHRADIADDGPALGPDLLDIDRSGLVEHQPHGVGASEHRRRRRRGKGEDHAKAVAVAPCVDGSGLRLCSRRRHVLRSLGRRRTALFLGRFRKRGFRRLRSLHRLGGLYRLDGLFGRLPGRLGGRSCLLGSCRRFLRGGRSGLGRGRRLVVRGLAGLDFDVGLLGDRLRRYRRRPLWRLLRPCLPCRRFAGKLRHGLHLGSRGIRIRHSQLLGGLFRLLERDIDDVVLFLAERAYVDFADQHDIDRGGIHIAALGDRGDVRRSGHLGVGEVEAQHVVELQRQLLVVEHRGNVDAVGHLENETHEGRLHRGANPYRRFLLGGIDRKLCPKRALGEARALGQFANDLGRKRRRRPGPAVGQEVDENALACRHGVDGRASCERKPDRHAVGIATRRADIIRNRVRQLVDGNIHRPLEADHDDRACRADVGIDVLGELQHQPRIAAPRRKRRLALDRVVGTGG